MNIAAFVFSIYFLYLLLKTFEIVFLFLQKDPSKLNEFGRAMLHGKGYDRWFDKSFNVIVGKNGRVSIEVLCVFQF